MSSLPSTMKAVLCDKTGGPEVLRYTEDQPVPKVGESEVLVKNKFGGINYIDTYYRTGLYPAPSWPLTLGQEGVGTVAAVGGSDVHGLKENDEVVYLKQGSYAEYTSVPADRVVKIPSGVSDDTVLGGFLMGMTALTLVKEAYEVKKGDTILVHAAAGGVGLLLGQILKDLGATAIGTASTKEKCDMAKEHGYAHMINYKDIPDWVPEVKKIAPEGVTCVYDSVGKTTWEGSLEAVKRKGSVIYFGNASGPVPPMNIALLSKKNTKIMRATLMQYVVTRDELEYYSNLLFDYLRDGKLKVNIHKIYDLKDVQQAHKDLEGRLTSGKLLIKTT
ncbi:NADPH:quinone reductase [Knufia obscura]|uniref:NADPH:quinone reductase n=2 Tax=Knufia TaxID=430999 RepID=A0ABR0RE17_9EURO|nr:NADPH:quinone reductase [Knufia obscura]KAK5949598.1 NADPH:quinone reductase [Knufia fluminis]